MSVGEICHIHSGNDASQAAHEQRCAEQAHHSNQKYHGDGASATVSSCRTLAHGSMHVLMAVVPGAVEPQQSCEGCQLYTATGRRRSCGDLQLAT